MLGKLEEVKGAFCGDNPTTLLNIEDHPPVSIGQKFSHQHDRRKPFPNVGGLPLEVALRLCRGTCRPSGAVALREGVPQMYVAAVSSDLQLVPERS
ncbi:hypothetical protein HPB47_018660 [Ixodes persulcatus]|uniref:Uncharacterized protein n=1 Tax=Ixodes persulcatus TaxID=34615 RepID=A0AC60QNT5_IXOPE|nr:hypothetical protein HPB47_018660 [Ixodes persulcatus]